MTLQKPLHSSFELRYLRYMHSIQNLNLNPLNVCHEVVSLIGIGSWVIAGKLAIFSYQGLKLELVAQLVKHLCSVCDSPEGPGHVLRVLGEPTEPGATLQRPPTPASTCPRVERDEYHP